MSLLAASTTKAGYSTTSAREQEEQADLLADEIQHTPPVYRLVVCRKPLLMLCAVMFFVVLFVLHVHAESGPECSYEEARSSKYCTNRDSADFVSGNSDEMQCQRRCSASPSCNGFNYYKHHPADDTGAAGPRCYLLVEEVCNEAVSRTGGFYRFKTYCEGEAELPVSAVAASAASRSNGVGLSSQPAAPPAAAEAKIENRDLEMAEAAACMKEKKSKRLKIKRDYKTQIAYIEDCNLCCKYHPFTVGTMTCDQICVKTAATKYSKVGGGFRPKTPTERKREKFKEYKASHPK